MKYGVHLWLWAADPHFDPSTSAAKAAKMGFDCVEVSIMALEEAMMKKLRRTLEEYDLECVSAIGLSSDTDVSSSDEKTRRRGIEYLESAAARTAELGGKAMAGVAYASWGRAPEGRSEDDWKNSVKSLKEVGRILKRYDVRLGLEPLNRFRSYMLNTSDEAIEMVDAIDEPYVGIHLDTFHMNMEEKEFYGPIKRAGHRLFHFHSASNDRGIPGTGHIDWISVYKALLEIGYDRFNVLESFTPGVEKMSSMTGSWRLTFPNPDMFASEGLKFLKGVESKVASDKS